ncbi:Glutamate receptor [Quillaja saponaria]|uniref:Glutamate receptor n=1 Tax=Quillaja saponaria TaxID=32244 RepID=A0AAD7QDZ9_QUISA|nr:Glutamate receptor [Quillaja saponaria]
MFLVNLGGKAQVPIISFSATSPFLSPTQSPYFIRTTQDDSYQVKAIASIVEAYQWHNVVLIYEDTEYGNGLIPYLTDAFQQIDVRVPYRCVISPHSDELTILKKLNMLRTRETRVFLVHMERSLSSKLFVLAKEAGMMSEGYAWIITNGLSSLLDSLEENVIDSMHGVLGVRPHVPMSKELDAFQRKWKKSFPTNKPHNKIGNLNVFALWAYDTIWALASAVEKSLNLNNTNSNALQKHINITNIGDFSGVRVSQTGPRLLQMLLRTRFKGLTGKLELSGGQVKPSISEIINVVGKRKRVIGFWGAKKGMFRVLQQRSAKGTNYTSTKEGFVAPTWPGNTKSPPKGWVIPVIGKKLRIGVPVIEEGYTEFVTIKWDLHTNEPTISGFSYDIFIAVLDKLPFALPHKFIPFMNSSRNCAGTYDELLYQIKLQKFDVVVGDTTIIANRSSYVDFTLPYTESGVSMVVKIKDDERKNMWIFLKPLSWDLWLTNGCAIVLTGVVVWFLEHRVNTDFRGPPKQQVGTIFWFSFSTLFFAHREKVVSNWSRFVLIIWIFVVLILTQSYTASLTSLLTVQRAQPAVVDVEELRRNNYFVGYQRNSFVRGLLIKQLNFDESKLRPYSTPEEYHEALSKGSNNGGVDAIFDEIPYIKLFVAKYCSKYTLVGPTYKTDGFGFAFPQGSPLVPYISKAILNVTQDFDLMQAIERKYFADQSTCQDPGSKIYSDSPSLSVYSFAGLFIITGITSMLSCLVYVIYFVQTEWHVLNSMHSGSSLSTRVTEFAKHFIKHVNERDQSCHTFNRTESNVGTVSSFNGSEASTDGNNLSNNSCYHDKGIDNIDTDKEDHEDNSTDYEQYIYGCA